MAMTPKAKAYQGERRRQFNEWMREYKLGRGCTDCGYNADSRALDFDHAPGSKAFSISRAANRRWEAVVAEMDKCEVVCANCHRIRTWTRHAALGEHTRHDTGQTALPM